MFFPGARKKKNPDIVQHFNITWSLYYYTDDAITDLFCVPGFNFDYQTLENVEGNYQQMAL